MVFENEAGDWLTDRALHERIVENGIEVEAHETDETNRPFWVVLRRGEDREVWARKRSK
jgi:hypothetical protein